MNNNNILFGHSVMQPYNNNPYGPSAPLISSYTTPYGPSAPPYPSAYQQPSIFGQSNNNYNENMYYNGALDLTPEQERARTAASVILLFVVVIMLPISILDIIALAKAGQNIRGISIACGESFYTFICANISLNWIMCIALTLTVGYLHRINAPTPTTLLAAVSFVYAVFSLAAVIIVAVSMSNPSCTKAISNVSWGLPLLGIAGYLNVGIDIVVMLVSGGLACMYHSPKQHIVMPNYPPQYYQQLHAPPLPPPPSHVILSPPPPSVVLSPSVQRPSVSKAPAAADQFSALAARQGPGGSLPS